MAVQQPQAPYLQIARRLCVLLLAAAAAVSCRKTEGEPPQLALSLDEVVLRSDAGATATFTVTATGRWSIDVSGEEFVCEPVEGTGGETLVTLTAASANSAETRRQLGQLTVTQRSGKLQRRMDVMQHPAVAPRLLLMYMPWSGNLTRYFEQNISDMEEVVAAGRLGDDRILVYFMPSGERAELFELCHDNGACIRLPHGSYDPAPVFTTSEGIASILSTAARIAPARRHAMTIGCHGMAWLPVAGAAYRSASGGASAQREKEYWEYAAEGKPLTRWFGGTSDRYRTDISTLAAGIAGAGLHMEYILFDDCYMASVEVAYELRAATDRLIGSTCEIMAYGFPYARMGQYLVGEVDYEGICDAFYDFYMNYRDPYGTISVTHSSELEALADVMSRINARYPAPLDDAELNGLQQLDGYWPVRFFDMGDYVRHLCRDAALLAEFEQQLERAVPSRYRRHTPQYYSMTSGVNEIRTFSGITTSDPSVSLSTQSKTDTSWWTATHR